MLPYRILLLLALLSPIASFAADAPNAYDCQVIVVANDFKDGSAEAKYRAIVDGGSHGGKEYDFDLQNHRVEILSDGKWLALTWIRDGKIIASATSLRTEATQNSMVLIVSNPANQEEQASVRCDAVVP